MELATTAFTSQPQSITALWPVLISSPTEGRRQSWPGWLVTYRGGLPARRWSPIPVLTGLDVEQLGAPYVVAATPNRQPGCGYSSIYALSATWGEECIPELESGYVMKVIGGEGQLVPFLPTATTDASYCVDGVRSLMASLSSTVDTRRCKHNDCMYRLVSSCIEWFYFMLNYAGRSVCLSVCLSRQQTHRDPPWGSMWRGQCTFRPENKEVRHTCTNLWEQKRRSNTDCIGVAKYLCQKMQLQTLPQYRHLANSTKYYVLLNFGPLAPLCENMTSST